MDGLAVCLAVPGSEAQAQARVKDRVWAQGKTGVVARCGSEGEERGWLKGAFTWCGSRQRKRRDGVGMCVCVWCVVVVSGEW